MRVNDEAEGVFGEIPRGEIDHTYSALALVSTSCLLAMLFPSKRASHQNNVRRQSGGWGVAGWKSGDGFVFIILQVLFRIVGVVVWFPWLSPPTSYLTCRDCPAAYLPPALARLLPRSDEEVMDVEC